MAKTVILIFVGFLSMAKHTGAICCESIKSEVEKKIEANKTLCIPGNTLPQNCCKDIANEVKRHVVAYETLCLKVKKGKTEVTVCSCLAVCVQIVHLIKS